MEIAKRSSEVGGGPLRLWPFFPGYKSRLGQSNDHPIGASFKAKGGTMDNEWIKSL